MSHGVGESVKRGAVLPWSGRQSEGLGGHKVWLPEVLAASQMLPTLLQNMNKVCFGGGAPGTWHSNSAESASEGFVWVGKATLGRAPPPHSKSS